jgi:hypothetical protein
VLPARRNHRRDVWCNSNSNSQLFSQSTIRIRLNCNRNEGTGTLFTVMHHLSLRMDFCVSHQMDSQWATLMTVTVIYHHELISWEHSNKSSLTLRPLQSQGLECEEGLAICHPHCPYRGRRYLCKSGEPGAAEWRVDKWTGQLSRGLIPAKQPAELSEGDGPFAATQRCFLCGRPSWSVVPLEAKSGKPQITASMGNPSAYRLALPCSMSPPDNIEASNTATVSHGSRWHEIAITNAP